MALTPSNMLPLGTRAPDFDLTSTVGANVSLADFSGKPLLLAFICNHCPFVKHVRAELAKIGQEYQAKGLGMVAINSNDVDAYPADSMANMQQEVLAAGYDFPYLLDSTQQVAKAYDASCTPDFFLFDSQFSLVYRGRLDASRPGNQVPVTGAELRAAIEQVLLGLPVASDQHPSVGCNIKWKPGNAPK